MKSIQNQYIDLKEGRMTQPNFMRNLRMSLPQYVTNVTSFNDAVKILKNKGILNENFIKEDRGMSLEDAKAEAKRISDDEGGVAQHVNKLENGKYAISDWYDADNTVASYGDGLDENIHNTAMMGGILHNSSKDYKEDKQAVNDIKAEIEKGLDKETAINSMAKKYGLRVDYLTKIYNREGLDENIHNPYEEFGLSSIENMLTDPNFKKEGIKMLKGAIEHAQSPDVRYTYDNLNDDELKQYIDSLKQLGNKYNITETDIYGIAGNPEEEEEAKKAQIKKEVKGGDLDHIKKLIDDGKIKEAAECISQASNKKELKKQLEGYPRYDVVKHMSEKLHLSEAKKIEGQDGKKQYSKFNIIDNLNAEEVFTGITIEMEETGKSKKDAAKIVIKNLKKDPFYYTHYKLTGTRDSKPETMDKMKPGARDMKPVEKNNLIDKEMGMKSPKGIEKVKASANKASVETVKPVKGVSLMSLIAKTVRGMKKMDATGEKMKKVTMRENMEHINWDTISKKDANSLADYHKRTGRLPYGLTPEKYDEIMAKYNIQKISHNNHMKEGEKGYELYKASKPTKAIVRDNKEVIIGDVVTRVDPKTGNIEKGVINNISKLGNDPTYLTVALEDGSKIHSAAKEFKRA